jgi:thiosulfate reductase/polysulfide reductase chain A
MSGPKLTRRGFLRAGGAAAGAGCVGVGVIDQLLASSDEAIDPSNLAHAPEAGELVLGACDMCGAQDPVLLQVVDGRVVATFGNALSSYAGGGKICGKAHAGLEKAYHPNRVTRPMMRRGPGNYVPVSWDEAIGFMADRLVRIVDTYGENAVHVYMGMGSQAKAWKSFWKGTFGTQNVFGNDSVCDASRRTAGALTMGESRPLPDLGHTKVGLLFGCDFLSSTKYLWYPTEMIRAMENGAKFYVVDPRFSETAARAVAYGGTWIPIKPGTDAALALAIANVVFNDPAGYEEHLDTRLVKWTESAGWHDGEHGFGVDRYAAAAAEWTPAKAEKVTGIPAAQIEEMADRLMTSDAACVDGWTGLAHRANGVYALRSVFCLAGLVNSIDKKGGLVRRNGFSTGSGGVRSIPNPVPPYRSVGRKDKLTRACGLYGFVRSDCNSFVAESMLDPGFARRSYRERRGTDPTDMSGYPVKAFISSGRNFAVGNGGSPTWRRAFNAMLDDPESLVVDVNLFISDQGAHSHLVLPEASYLERDDLFAPASLYPAAHIRKAAIAPIGESKTFFDMTAMLIDALAARRYKGGAYSAATLLPYDDYTGIMKELVTSKHGTEVWDTLQKHGVWETQDPTPRYGREGFGWSKLGKFTDRFEFFCPTLAGERPPDDALHPDAKARAALDGFAMPPPGTFEGAPVHRDTEFGPPAEKFPLQLSGCGRNQWNSGSKTPHIASSIEREPENLLSIHPADAHVRGVLDRDRVRVTSPTGGEVVVKANVTEGIRPGVVHLSNGFGQTHTTEANARRRGANVNELTSHENIDPIAGSDALAEMHVQVEIA